MWLTSGFICQVQTEKKECNCTRATMGGNLIKYPEDVGMPTANLMLIKILLNCVTSIPGAWFATTDVANFYLMMQLKWPKFVKIKLIDIPAEIILEYSLCNKATPHEWIYVKVVHGMFGLPQEGSLGHKLLDDWLHKAWYFQSKIVPVSWKHTTQPKQFTIVVNDFGIKISLTRILTTSSPWLNSIMTLPLTRMAKSVSKYF